MSKKVSGYDINIEGDGYSSSLNFSDYEVDDMLVDANEEFEKIAESMQFEGRKIDYVNLTEIKSIIDSDTDEVYDYRYSVLEEKGDRPSWVDDVYAKGGMVKKSDFTMLGAGLLIGGLFAFLKK